MNRIKLSSVIAIALCFGMVAVNARENVSGSGIIVNQNQVREMQSNCNPATSQADLDINNVRARILGGGDMWWNLSDGSYFVPKPEAGKRGPSSMFAASLWIGGYDAGGTLKLAGQTYRQTGNDFWPGPLNTSASTDANTCLTWDKHFIVDRQDVEDYNAWFEGGQIGAYTIPSSITDWPTVSAEGKPMAPYHDYDGDGTYNPAAGDYPDFDIKGTKGCSALLYGDQAMFWVFNDKGNIHSETGGPAIGLEVKAQAFGFKTTDEINNMTFYKYIITNKSSFRLDSTYFGVWCDSDLGAYNDDYVGCDVGLGLGYSYNGDAFDGPSGNGELIYGSNPPAVGIDFFEGPFADADGIDNPSSSVPAAYIGYGDGTADNERIGMAHFIYYNNDQSPVNGNPNGADDFYQYLTGSWKNAQLITYGGNGTTGSVVCKYMFPGTSDPSGFGTNGIPQPNWDEVSSGNVPADRRFLQSAGPFTLQPGAVNTITKGVVWARATQGGNTASLALLKGADYKAQQLFNNCFKTLDGPTAPNLGIQELDKELILYWSNPANSNNFNEKYKEDYDILGGSDVPYTFQGYMVYQLKDAFVSETDIYDVNKARLIYQCDIADGVSQIVNYNNDLTLTALIPQEMVKGEDKGVTHSLKVTEDKFATGNTALVNHKTYYFAIIAYGYSPTQIPTNLNQLNDYKPFIAGRKQADGYFSHSAIPHIPSPEAGGTEAHSTYGSGPKLKRIEGQGNGGNVLDLTAETVANILASPNSFDPNPVYETGSGPVAIRVVDPLNVPENDNFRFILKSRYVNLPTSVVSIALDSSRWELQNLTSGVTVKSESIIKLPNEQIINGQPSGSNTSVIPKWGLSVNVKFIADPGDKPTGTGWPVNTWPDPVENGFLEATMEFADPTKKWLSAIADVDGNTNLNWIRSGTVSEPTATQYNDILSEDDDQVYEKVLGGTWAPYRLCGRTVITSGQGLQYVGGPAWNHNISNAANKLSNLASVDIIFTSDKTKWTRCPVLELQEETALSIGGAVKMNMRKSPSIDKNGLKTGDAGYNAAEGDFSGGVATPTGMGWFPGYAINIETGERLNMAYGEDSWLATDNGTDMKWNPTSTRTGFGGSPIFGGKHYIYIFGHNGDTKFLTTDAQLPSQFKDMRRYDEGLLAYKILKVAETLGSSADNSYKKEVYLDAMWVNIPILASGHELLETDVKVRLRVAKTYKKGWAGTIIPSATLAYTDSAANPINANFPVYEFNSSDIATHKNDKETAKKALDLINIVPNPYYAYSSYEQKTLENLVKITNLPEKCKVSIYTLNGNLIKTFNKDDPKTSLDWDLKNNKRIPIASGLYIIHIDVPEVGEKVLKWFGVMRPQDLESF